MRSANRIVGIVLGAGFVLLGVVGFIVPPEGGVLLGILQSNPLQSAVHLVLGATLVVAAMSSLPASRLVNAIVGAVLLVFGLAGLFLVGSPANVFVLSVADNAVHFGAAAVLLAAGLGANRPDPD